LLRKLPESFGICACLSTLGVNSAFVFFFFIFASQKHLDPFERRRNVAELKE
jgi:hypothetical protein